MAKTAAKVAQPNTENSQRKTSSPARAVGTATPEAGRTATTNVPTLPASLIKALPVSIEIMKHLRAIEALAPQLDRELAASEKGGAIAMARAFVVLHRLREYTDTEKDTSLLKPILRSHQRISKEVLPYMLEVEGVTNVPLAEGFRVQKAEPFYASVKKGRTEAAYEWLSEHGLGDLIKPTVNSSSLSAALKQLVEEHNLEAPDDIFTAAYVPTMSVVKT